MLDALEAGVFSPDDRKRYTGLVDTLRHHDYFMVCADFESYRYEQRQLAALWRDPAEWWRTSIMNTARVGWFSSDRAIAEYAREIWQADSGSDSERN